ncbi:MAG: hypothetical protein ABEH81_14870 [Halopenitus sp.]
MRRNTIEETAETTEPAEDQYDQYTGYEDDGALVICDRTNPRAWIRSETTTKLDC